MATAADVIDGALESLGVNNELSISDPYLEGRLFKALVRLLNRWVEAGIDLSITIPTVAADELGNPSSTDDALITSLAIVSQKIVKTSASLALKKDQKIFYRQMKAAYGLWPQQSMPPTLPFGQGNNLGPRSKRFFPETDTSA